MSSISPVRRALVRRLAARSPDIGDRLTALVEQRVERLGGEEHEWVRSSAQTNIELLLQVMASPDDLSGVAPPLGGVALARRLAAHEVPFYELVRGYQHAESFWVQLCLRELATLTSGVDELVAEAIELSELVRSYIDLVCRELSVEYETERDRWRQRDDSARITLVTALLHGSDTEPAAAEATLGYRLGGPQLAAILWLAEPESGEVRSALNDAAATLGRLARCAGRPLVIARDHTTLWVWLPLPDQHPAGLANIADVLPTDGAQLRVALGEPSAGLPGFLSSHRQARAAYEVGLAAGHGVGPVFPYADVSPLAFLCADLPRARAWVGETLGHLAAAGARERELRRAVALYSAANCSDTAAARLMNCHKNTVQYRIRSAERLLGRRVDDGGVDLNLALLACHWLGDAVTGPGV